MLSINKKTALPFRFVTVSRSVQSIKTCCGHPEIYDLGIITVKLSRLRRYLEVRHCLLLSFKRCLDTVAAGTPPCTGFPVTVALNATDVLTSTPSSTRCLTCMILFAPLVFVPTAHQCSGSVEKGEKGKMRKSYDFYPTV